MTISRRQPLLYYLLLILLLQRSNRIGDGAVLYLNDNNYGNAFYQDINYYDTFDSPQRDLGNGDVDKMLVPQDHIEDAPIDDEQSDSVQQLDNLPIAEEQERDAYEQEKLAEMVKAGRLDLTDEEATQRKREASESANEQHQDQEQKAAYTCHAQTSEQQACLDAAVKDTKDTIEHVTTLIKRMREHAVAIVKEINELEGDFLGACQDERPKANCPKQRPISKGSCKAPYGMRQEEDAGDGGYIDGTGGFKRIENQFENNNNNQNRVNSVGNNNNRIDNENRNDNENNNNSKESGGNVQNVNTNTNTKPNSKGAPTKPRILINEFGAPMLTDTADLPPNQFIEQAQYAVHAWKHQIEECKRLLDEAMLHATQQQSTDSADSPQTSVQHIIKIVKSPEEMEGMHEYDAAPAAAASITPVRSAKEVASIDDSKIHSNNNNNNNKINNENAASLKAKSNLVVAGLKCANKNDDKLVGTGTGEGSKAVHGDNNNDADSDINDSTNNKRNEDSKKCRSDGEEKKHRAIPPLLSVLQGMGF